MKKVLSFVLVLALVLGSFSMAFAAEVQSDVTGKTCENAVMALEDLGVVAGYPDGTFKPENTVTRAEAAKMVIAALGLTAQAEGNATTFADCQGHWAAGYIGYAQALGVLKGRTATTFDPNGNVSYQELITMLVRAVGYTDASLPGTWPANYVSKAKGLGLLKDVEKAGNASAVRGDVAIMLFNTLEKPLGYINDENTWVAFTPGESMLSRLDKAATQKGQEIVLDEKDNYADGVDLSNYYGAYATVYLNEDGEITGLKEVKSTFLTATVTTDAAFEVKTDDVDYIVANSRTGFVLFNNSRVNRTVEPSTGAAFTGAALVAAGIETGDEVTMAVKMDGKKIKEIYSINVLSDKATVIWGDKEVSKLNKNHKIGNNEFQEDKNGDIDNTSFTLIGAKSLADITKDSAVTYYTDLADKYISRVEVSTEKVEGTVSKVKENADASKTKYTINGKAYKWKAATGESKSDLKLGAEGTAWINYNGKIVKFEGKSDPDSYAMIHTDAKFVAGTGYDSDEIQVKLYTADGVKKVFTINEDVTIGAYTAGGLTAATAPAELTAAGLKKATGTFVSYTLNKDGEIDEFTATTGAQASGKFSNNGYLDKKEIASNVVVFTGGLGDFSVGTLKDIPTGEDLHQTYYIMDEDNEYIVCIWTNEDASGTYGFITNWGEVKNADGDKVFEVTAFVDGKEVTYLTEDKGLRTEITGAKCYELVEFTFTAGNLTGIGSPLTASTSGIVTDGGVGKGTLDFGHGFEQVNNAVVYKVILDTDNTIDTIKAAEYTDITAGDKVLVWDTDDDVEGYTIVLYVEEDDITNAGL